MFLSPNPLIEDSSAPKGQPTGSPVTVKSFVAPHAGNSSLPKTPVLLSHVFFSLPYLHYTCTFTTIDWSLVSRIPQRHYHRSRVRSVRHTMLAALISLHHVRSARCPGFHDYSTWEPVQCNLQHHPCRHEWWRPHCSSPKYAVFVSGAARITIPNSPQEAFVHAGKNGLVFAADTAALSRTGHTSIFFKETVLIQIPTAGGVVPPHKVLHLGPCRGKELFECQTWFSRQVSLDATTGLPWVAEECHVALTLMILEYVLEKC